MSTGNDQIDQRYLDAIADADQYPYWMEDADEPDSNPTLVRTESCDLCVVGGGYTGLWTAIIAKERDPSADVVLIDAHECGSAASGRNGGFMDASLTHGVGNAMALALPPAIVRALKFLPVNLWLVDSPKALALSEETLILED